MPSSKQCNSSRVYSLKVSPLCISIFYISAAVSRERQCILSPIYQVIIFPFLNWNTFQRRIVQCGGWKFQFFTHVLSSKIFMLVPNPIRWQMCPFYFSSFGGLIHTSYPMPSLGWIFHIHCVLVKHTLLFIHFSYYLVSNWLHIQSKYPPLVHWLAVGANAPIILNKTLHLPT